MENFIICKGCTKKYNDIGNNFEYNSKGEQNKTCNKCRERYQNTKDKYKDKSKQYYQEHKEHRNEYGKQWYYDNHDYLFEQIKCDVCERFVCRKNIAKHMKTQFCQKAKENNTEK